MSVGGTPALEQDSIHSLFAKLPLMVVLLITTTTILMFLAFGSMVLPIKAALMSALTLGSTMGMLTWMFVDGHGSGLMNYTPQPLMAPMIGLIIAVIWGLSTDYEVFLVSRMVEARARGMSTAEAIRIGTATTGRLITGAALVLAVVAGAFVFSDLVMMKYLAFGLLIALLLDATIIRMFLVPGDHEAARRRLLVGAAVDEARPGAARPRRDRAARRAQAAHRPRARGRSRGVGRCRRPGVAARPPHDPGHPDGGTRRPVPGGPIVPPARPGPRRSRRASASPLRRARPASRRPRLPPLLREAPTTRFAAPKDPVDDAAAPTQRTPRVDPTRPPVPTPTPPPVPNRGETRRNEPPRGNTNREIESWLG